MKRLKNLGVERREKLDRSPTEILRFTQDDRYAFSGSFRQVRVNSVNNTPSINLSRQEREAENGKLSDSLHAVVYYWRVNFPYQSKNGAAFILQLA